MVEMNRAMKSYNTQNIDGAIAAASPHQLIGMLLDGSIRFVNTAKFHMQNGDISQKGLAISRAIACIEGGLRAALNKEVGGKLAENLDSLYDYLSNRLLVSNINNDISMLDEVNQLLREIKEGWDEIGAQTEAAKGAQVEPPVSPDRAPNSYGKA